MDLADHPLMGTEADEIPNSASLTRHSNRHRRQEPAGGLFWCGRCDRDLVPDVEKCRVCGARNGKPGRMRKPGPLP
jgi:hypothetical protein